MGSFITLKLSCSQSINWLLMKLLLYSQKQLFGRENNKASERTHADDEHVHLYSTGEALDIYQILNATNGSLKRER